jgi:hypothetical protein
VRDRIVPDDEICDWLESHPRIVDSTPQAIESHEQRSSAPMLRIIAAQDSKFVSRFASIEPSFPVKKAIFESITSHFDISPMFITSAFNQDAVCFEVGYRYGV